MNIGQLIFSPLDLDYQPEDIEKITSALRSIRLIGEPLTAEKYLVGDAFVNLISFLGCSPMIQLKPRADMAFCYFHFPSPQAQRTLMASHTLKPPRCPHCKKAVDNWQNLGVHDVLHSCLNCQKTSLFSELIWRRKAMIFSRWHISLWNIYESEAVPSPSVLSALKTATGVDWSYSYITQ